MVECGRDDGPVAQRFTHPAHTPAMSDFGRATFTALGAARAGRTAATGWGDRGGREGARVRAVGLARGGTMAGAAWVGARARSVGRRGGGGAGESASSLPKRSIDPKRQQRLGEQDRSSHSMISGALRACGVLDGPRPALNSDVTRPRRFLTRSWFRDLLRRGVDEIRRVPGQRTISRSCRSPRKLGESCTRSTPRSTASARWRKADATSCNTVLAR